MPINYEAELARLDLIIADAEIRIERQRELIQKTSTRGLPIDDARKTLDVMLGVMQNLHHYRAAILRLWKGRLH